MDRKENKGGTLSNEELEQDLKVRNVNTEDGGYYGSQDTGVKDIRIHEAKEDETTEEDDNRAMIMQGQITQQGQP